jgi:hypothetical protein
VRVTSQSISESYLDGYELPHINYDTGYLITIRYELPHYLTCEMMSDFGTDNGGTEPMEVDMKGKDMVRLKDMPPGHVNVGPFHVCNLPDYVRGATVGRDNIPVVLYEARFKMVEGKPEKQEKWAVMVPPRKDIGIVCAGCYAPTMSLWDKSRCVSCRTFANHLDVVLCVDPENPKKRIAEKDEDGNEIRKRPCLAFGPSSPDPEFNHLVTIMEKVKDAMPPVNENEGLRGQIIENETGAMTAGALTLTMPVQAFEEEDEMSVKDIDELLPKIPECDLLEELRKRHMDGLAGFLSHINMKDIKAYVKENDKIGRKARALKKLRG